MGREIRKVPPDWEHPKDENGNYKPMFDKTYDEEVERWEKERDLWEKGKHSDQEKYDDTPEKYSDWSTKHPSCYKEYFRPEFKKEPTAYQVYENVSEGTPKSPVFETLEELREWLIDEKGYSKDAVEEFIEYGSAPSFTLTANMDTEEFKVEEGIDCLGKDDD